MPHADEKSSNDFGNGINDGNPKGNFYDPDLAHPAVEYNDAHVTAPPSMSERKLITKIDLHVIPVLSILYLLAFLDRTNIANASIYGLVADLKLKGIEYNTALTIFFVPYIVFEIPSNILVKRLKPHVWLSMCMFMFGVVTICQGLVQNYSGLLATRFFLGFFETGMFPGSFYLIGMWYKRYEAQKRYSFFFASTTLAGAFGGLLASVIGKMNGIRGYLGWRWIFILEGTLTAVVAIAFFFLIPDFPEDAKWLTEEERAFVKTRLQDDQGKSTLERRITFKDVLHCFKDYKIFLGGLMYFGLVVPAYGYAYFAPSIIKSYGYSNIQTQFHSVPPWAAAFGFSMLVAFFSDRLRHRFLFAMVPIAISIAGFAILITTHHNRHLEYGALFLVTCGTYSAMPIIVCWFTMNLGGHHRRAVGAAWQIGFGNIGGIIATYSFPAKDAKSFYHTGYSICTGFICLSALSCCLYFMAVVSQNRNRDKTNVVMTDYEKTEKGDLSPDYRYVKLPRIPLRCMLT
jgi:MFS family permease